MVVVGKLLCATVELKLSSGPYRRVDRIRGSSFLRVPSQETNSVGSLSGQITFLRATSEGEGLLGVGDVVEAVEGAEPGGGQQSHKVSEHLMPPLVVSRELLPLVVSVGNRDTQNDRAHKQNSCHESLSHHCNHNSVT